MDTNSSNSILYHYTDSAALVGILTTGELWFSDIRFLNDARELHFARDIIRHGIKKVADQHRKKWMEAGCVPKQFDQMVENMTRTMCANWHRWLGVPVTTTHFIFSMTANPDSLSQWRAYGNGQYCIGFDKSKLLEKIDGVELVDIEYKNKPEDVEFSVAGLDEFFVNHLVHIDKSNGTIDEEVLHDGADEFFSRDKKPYAYERSFLVKYKDYGFHEEDEYRLLLHIDPATDGRIIFATNGPYPRPRAKIKIFDRGDGFSVVKEIKVGPGLDQELAKAALDVVFANKRCECIKVSNSTIPYRTKWE